MFDINTDAHRYYLADLDRAYTQSRQRTAPAEMGSRRTHTRLALRTVSILLAFVLGSSFYGATFF